MRVKVLEICDRHTFFPVICVHPVADNQEQFYLLRRDGYAATDDEPCVIMIDAQCRGASYDPHDWGQSMRTKTVAHRYITDNWADLRDGDVTDVEFILGETENKKLSERLL